ncbi:uncharacterized protein LOC100678130 [Nasonia vitripennis]|uniref:Uncharacterized protein n=1 Tax=Nasonia vitripennis TaxID=7425 RepID=A0A7M7QBK6_NASVI|nr:uncharacterized protein LOC100678130 [Nasonia vitripennis]
MEKQESVSRQSSILKPPKQRQPLQCVATNPSSSENSPTIKIKRRVSFAKNKRIREFCNEAEQGTVWDNTYEEHDLSNPKNNSNDHPVVISVPCHDKENFPVQLFLKSDELDCKEVPQNTPTEDGDHLSQSDMEMDSSINNSRPTRIEEQHSENQYENETIYCDDGMDMTNYIPSEIVPCQRHDNDAMENHLPGPQNCIQNTSMEITRNLPSAYSNNDKHLLASNSTDLTQAISALLSSGCVQKLNNPTNLEAPNAEPSKSKMDCSNTAAMEFTSVLPSSTWIRPNSRCQNDDRTENLTKTMEFTMAVPCSMQKAKNADKSNGFSEKTNIFTNRSMEMTEPVFTVNKDNNHEIPAVVQEKTKLFLNNSMEMTEVVSIFDKIRQIENNLQPCTNSTVQEKTKIFVNNSMEMTEAVPSLDKICTLDNNRQLLNNVTSQEKTKIFMNNSMEMTEAVPIKNIVRQLDENTQLSNNLTMQEQTKIFPNNSMEMTEAVPISNKFHQVSSEQPITNSTVEEKTKIFSNKSMEITEAISVYKNANIQTANEKTKVFSNHSMEITEVVPVRQFPTDLERQTHLTPHEKTKVFINNSMEMTELIPGHVESRRCVLLTDKSLHDITENKTKIFVNKPMEITQAIASGDKPSNYSKNVLDEEGLEKTQIGLNMSIEMTEAVPVCNMIPSNIGPLHNNFQEKTNIFFNKSMDINETVAILSNIHGAIGVTEVETRQLLSEKTKLFSNTSMEMTEAITANKKYPDDEEQKQNKTRIFANKSIDISETIPVGHPNIYAEQIASESLKEGTNTSRSDVIKTSNVIPIYHDSYEYKGNTNVVQSKSNKRYRQFDSEPTNERKKSSPNICLETKPTQHGQEVEKTKVFLNKSMDISETIPIQGTANTNIDQYHNPSAITQEKTKIYHNGSMDMTEVISTHTKAYEPNNLLKENLNNDRRECFPNKSMDITENIPVKQIVFPILETKKMFDYIAQDSRNNLMNISETIPVKQNAPSFSGISADNMDMTEMVPVHHQVSGTNLNHEKTRIFLDKSMDVTETVASNKSNFQSISQRRDVPDEATQIFSNAPMEFTSQISTLPNVTKMQPSVAGNNQNDNLTKVLQDATMEFTELPTSFPGISNNSKPFNQSDFGASSNNVNVVQGSINASNNFHKRSNYDISDRFSTRDESFHRITSDELNTLCASMNLPTQKYSRDESVNTQTNFIPSCNDVNVLRDSLQKNSMFQVPDQFNAENNSRVSNSSKNIKESSLTQVRREGTINMDLSVINKNEADKSIAIENYFNKSVTAPVTNMDKTAEISLDLLEQQQIHCGSDQVKNQNNVFIEKSPTHPMNESVTVQNAANVSNKNIRNVCTAPNNCEEAFTRYIEPEKSQNSKVQIYHDTSMESVTNPLTLLTDARSNKTNVPVANCNENENCAQISRENSLTRLPSDNTDLLIATMGIKTKLTYPLIINDKTTITISNKSFTSKSYSMGTEEENCIETNKTYVVDENIINPRESSKLISEEVQNEEKKIKISMAEDDKECVSFAKETNQAGVEIDIFSEKFSEELDEIQPPSFLDSDSMQDDDLSDQLERLSSSNRLDSILSDSNEKCVTPDEAELKDDISFNDTLESSKHSEAEKQKRLSSCDSDYSFKNKSNEISSPKKDCVHLPFTPVNNESKKDLIEEPISPFLSLTENLKTEEMRDDCIWAIRAMKPNIIAIDFISKSFVVVLRLNEMEMINCIRDVEKIEFVSRIRADSKNVLLKIVHRLLLLKLNPDEMIKKCKMYEDILPMLQYISKEVVFFMNFMFDLERLSAMNLITIDIERITFMVSSRKSNIILKVLLKLKLFDEIGPNDIDLTCVLGDIRKNDIKQLIVNIKKDYKFLSRYITDVKDYITLIENHV